MYCTWCRRRLLLTDCICPGCGAPVLGAPASVASPPPALAAPPNPPPASPPPPNWGNTSSPVMVSALGPSFLIRALWFIFVGWWLAWWAIGFGYLLMMTLIGLPLAFWLFDRVPAVLTLRPRTMVYQTYQHPGGSYTVASTVPQIPLISRVLWFLCIGWWLTGLWLLIAYLLLIPLITIPLSVMMLNRVDSVMTLQRH